MDTINNNPGLNHDLYWQEEGIPLDDGSNQKLNQEDFFALLTEQLANQDPTKPVDNDQMVAQMTSFSMAEGISDLNEKFNNFATSMTSNQALQASSLIGQEVLLPGGQGYSSEQRPGMSGVVVAENAVQELQITIETPAGEVVKTIEAGAQSAGNIQFNWDGKDSRGNLLPPGNYVVKAQGAVLGEQTSMNTAVNRHIDSVSLAGSSQGVILNLDGQVSAKLSDVIQIGG